MSEAEEPHGSEAQFDPATPPPEGVEVDLEDFEPTDEQIDPDDPEEPEPDVEDADEPELTADDEGVTS